MENWCYKNFSVLRKRLNEQWQSTPADEVGTARKLKGNLQTLYPIAYNFSAQWLFLIRIILTC
jgi:hypothetical protein